MTLQTMSYPHGYYPGSYNSMDYSYYPEQLIGNNNQHIAPHDHQRLYSCHSSRGSYPNPGFSSSSSSDDDNRYGMTIQTPIIKSEPYYLENQQLSPVSIQYDTVEPADCQYANVNQFIKHSPKERVYCTHPDCLDEKGTPTKYFSRKADVARHDRSQHNITYIDCPKRNCLRKDSQGFTRHDHLVEHLRGYHQEDIPKRSSSSGERSVAKPKLSKQQKQQKQEVSMAMITACC